ncbi:MAG: hypothetical protein MZV70_53390 [Desulfobacterales bacterium]|nr:hypothetical protein [Desulfobacterales bacterium]
MSFPAFPKQFTVSGDTWRTAPSISQVRPPESLASCFCTAQSVITAPARRDHCRPRVCIRARVRRHLLFIRAAARHLSRAETGSS